MNIMKNVVDALNKNYSQSLRNSRTKIKEESFYTEFELNTADLELDILNMGPIKFPLKQEDIQKLIEHSSEARFGLREKTLLNKNVRDTFEISAEKIKIRYNESHFMSMLEKMKIDLKLPEKSKLVPHLHNLLIYGPGQFFKTHQDSEKLEGMVASLIVVLPSPHIGGDLIIQHKNHKHYFVSENLNNQNLKCVVFYADCPHEIKKIKQGFRVALTYNLVLESGNIDIPHQTNLSLENALIDYFGLEDKELINKHSAMKFIYLLDHSYTEHSLRWNMLKGIDHLNALDFRDAAKKLDLKSNLALVEFHESWTAEDEDSPDDLIYNNVEIIYWMDEKNIRLPYKNYSTSEDECCFSIKTKEFEPYEKEYEGFMGNYGNTVDYWYRRAAIVLWREYDQVVLEFELNHETALNNLLNLTKKTGREKHVLDIIYAVDDYLIRKPSYGPRTENFNSFLKLASYIQNKETAKDILSDFSLDKIKANDIIEFSHLKDMYDVNWCIELLENWKNVTIKHDRFDSPPRKDLQEIVRELIVYKNKNRKIIEFLLNYQLYAIMQHNRKYSHLKPIELANSLKERLGVLIDFIKTIQLFEKDFLSNELVEYLMKNSTLYPELELMDIFFEIYKNGDYPAGFKELKIYAIENLSNELELGLKDENDWSIKAKLPCKCEYCKIATDFIISKTETRRIWPLVTHHRDHIIDIVQGLGLPVNLSVEKKGSPYKLIIVKNDNLHQNARNRYLKLRQYHEKLLRM